MNIPAPSQQYDSYNYAYTSLRQTFVNDTGSDYGMGGYDYGYDQAAVDAYKQQLAAYIQQAKAEYAQLQAGDPRRAQVEAYIQQAYQYASQVGLIVDGNPGMNNEWDPLAASTNGGYGITPSYQDPNKVIYEDILPAMTADKNNLKEEHFYAPPYDFTVPGSATANVTSEVDPNHPDKTRICVTVTWPDGKVKRHYFYNVDWKDTGLTIRSTSPENQITLDASVAENSHVSTSEIGGNNESSQAGDPPTRMDGDKRIYDGQDFDISPVEEGDNKETKVMASGDVIITPNSNEEFYVVDYQDGKYIVKVYASDEDFKNKKVKETITIDGALVDNIHFLTDPSRIAFTPALREGSDIHTLNTSKEADKISLETEDSESENLTDTPPDSKEGNTAVYETQTDVELHASYDNTTVNHQIWASNSVTIHGASNRDGVVLVYDEAKDTLVVEIYKNGDTNSEPETFFIHNAKETNIILDVPGESSIISTQNGAKDMVQIGLDGKTASEKVSEVEQAKAEEIAEGKEIVDNFLKVTGKNEAQLLSALKASGFNYNTIEDLYKAVQEKKFPPNPPTTQLLKFFTAIDSTFDGAYKQILRNQKDINPRREATNRLIELLSTLYPEHNISTYYGNAQEFHLVDDISIDGKHYQWFWEKENSYDAGGLQFINFDA